MDVNVCSVSAEGPQRPHEWPGAWPTRQERDDTSQRTKTYVSADGSAVWLTGETSEDVQHAHADAVALNSAAMVAGRATQSLKETPNVGSHELYGTWALTLQALDDVLPVA